MRAVLYHTFGGPLFVEEVQDPEPAPDGVVIEVAATGLCRSDWHGWQGHDPDICALPHVPGHEFAGTIAALGSENSRLQVGQRVTMPFVAGCGNCPECAAGQQQICDFQFQPGFTAWGSFAEFLAVRYADENVVSLPEEISFEAAASLGCRFATAYRAVALQGRVGQGEWIAIHGCGGVGLSAVMIAGALGARPLAVDINPRALTLAKSLGAEVALNASEVQDIPAAIHQITGRGAQVSLDALGSVTTFHNSIYSLRKRGRHVQVGLLAGSESDPPAPMSRVIAWELELVGSHGLQAHCYPQLFELLRRRRLRTEAMIGEILTLAEVPAALAGMGRSSETGVKIIHPQAS